MPSVGSTSPITAGRQAFYPKGRFNPSQKEEDPLTVLKTRFAGLKEKISEADELAAKHVYHNPDLSMIDVRQHRLIPFLMIDPAMRGQR